MVTTLLALQAQARPGYVWVVQFVLIVGVVYFLMIMPQRKERKRHQEMLAALKPGDDVVTAGGLIGEIISIKDEGVIIKTGEARVLVERARIARLVTPPAA